MWAPVTPSPQVPSVWYFLITMRWVTNAVTFQITSKNVVVKGRLVNVLGFLDHRVPVTETQLSHQSSCKQNLRTGYSWTHYNFLYRNIRWQEFDKGADTCSAAYVGERWISEQSEKELSKRSSPLWLGFLCKNLLHSVLVRLLQDCPAHSWSCIPLHRGLLPSLGINHHLSSLATGFLIAVSQRKERVSRSDKYRTGKASRKEEVEGEASLADKGSSGQSLRDAEEEEGCLVRTLGR